MKSVIPKTLGLSTVLIWCLGAWGQEWIKSNDKLEIQIESEQDLETLHFLLDGVDVTGLVSQVSPKTFRYASDILPLPKGEIALVVYLENEGEWQELKTEQLYVLSQGGFEHSAFTASSNLSIESQWDAEAKGDGSPIDDKEFHNGNAQVSLGSEQRRGDLALTSNMNLVAVTKRENALRFGQANAPRVDLSDYVASLQTENLSFSFGHISYGEHPLLISGLANRGVSMTYKLSSSIDIGLSQQSGSAIVGWDNFLGLNNSRHKISASTVGFEAWPAKPGKIRIEYTLLQGKTEAINDFDVGQVNDVEENTGWGVTLTSQWFSNRLRLNGAYARSEFSNPSDEVISFGNDFDQTDLVEVEQSDDTAWQYRFEFDLVGNTDEGAPSPYATLLSYERNQIDALYRVLAAFPSADTSSENLTLQGQIHSAGWQYSQLEQENNVDNIPSILKTQSQTKQFGFNLNVANLIGNKKADQSSSWSIWPQLSLNTQRVHQFATNNPDELISGFNGGSHLPDQYNILTDMNLTWSFGRHSLGYSYSDAMQDNRQVGRERADFDRKSHNLTASLSLFERLSANMSFGRAENFDLEQQNSFFNRNGNLSLNLSIFSNWNLDINYSLNKDFDNLGNSESDAETYGAGVSNNWTYRKISGQWNLRFILQKNQSEDNVFNFNSFAENSALTSSLSVSF